MGTTISGPSFDSNWNGALGTLSHALFPDPSRAAQAYYYGTEARNKILSGDTAITEANSAQRALAMQMALDRMGPQPGPVTYHPSGLPGGAPIMDPPNTSTDTYYTPPGVPGPDGPHPVQLYQNYGEGSAANPKGFATTGVPAPASSPAPNAGAPPAPNTTTSNGQVPPNDQGSGVLHPGSVTAPDGGVKMSGPAAADGSPAKPAFTLGTYVALQAMAGRNAEAAKIQGLSYITSAWQHGLIDTATYHQMLGGLGNTGMYESDQATNRAVTVANIQEGGAIKREGMRLGERWQEFQGTPLQHTGVDPNSGQSTLLYPGTPQGTPLFNQAQFDRMQQPTQVWQTDKNGQPDYTQPPRTVPYWQAVQGKLPIYTQGQGGPQVPASAEEAIMSSGFVRDEFANAYTPGDPGFWRGGHPFAATPTNSAESAVTDYANFLRERSHNTMPVKEAFTQARQALEQQGYLPSKEQVDASRAARWIGTSPHPALRLDAQGKPAGWNVPLLKPYLSPRGNGMTIQADTNQSGANIDTPNVDTSKMQPTMPSSAGAARSGAGAGAGGGASTQPAPVQSRGVAIGRAPPGATPGQSAWVGGQEGRVGNDGLIYPVK